MKNLALIIAAGSVAAIAVPAQAFDLPAAPAPVVAAYGAAASPFADVASYDRRWDDDRRWRDDRRGRDDRRWRDNGRNEWRGDDGRLRCRRNDGTVGLVIGAGAGALLGREIDGRGDRALGTILGAVGGGLLGREVARGGGRCR
jgi:hypothetical protein